MGQIVSKKAKASSHDKAVFELKRQRDNLRKYQQQLNHVIARETEIAKAALRTGDKRRALLALRKKKYQEQLLDKSDKQLLTLEEMTASIEYKMLEKQVFDGIQQGNTVLQELNKEMSLEKVEALMQDTEDAIAYQKEVEEMLGTKLSDEDEADVLAEFAAIEKAEAEALGADMPKVPTEPLPDKPPQEVPADAVADAAAEEGEEEGAAEAEHQATSAKAKPEKHQALLAE